MNYHRDNPHFQKICALKFHPFLKHRKPRREVQETGWAGQCSCTCPLGSLSTFRLVAGKRGAALPSYPPLPPATPHLPASDGPQRCCLTSRCPAPKYNRHLLHFRGTSPAAARLSREATVDTYWLAASQEGGAGRGHLDCLAAPASGGPDWLEAQRRPVS